ncbi:glycosyltransferase family 8 protein [Gilliamella apicola]|uniref:Glycosyltransferase family 8 protein n=1 Tax=Gilliamella apicola TaxID=1196095 RepID=A0A556RTV4_9GAMM|nr:glycosyltransferase family 8 protein [Gilliamella apicola]TSJ92332.1 glycosyltransferase family 8 protein [Gilliamella apicola]
MFNAEDFIESKKTIVNNHNSNYLTLHIALGFDNNYALPAGVTISSVIKNTPNYNLHFHLFVDKVSKSNIDKFKQLANDKIAITLYTINSNFIINPKTLVLHITTISTCIRFIIPDILFSITDRIIYLDSDTICLQSLEKLERYSIENYIAGVIPDSLDMQKEIKAMYKINAEKYFNAGVLLINTKRWCEEKISQKAFDLINSGKIYKYADQDVLNILLENKTLLLPIKFNTKIKIAIDAHQEKEIRPYTVILHYISQNKPWFKVYQSEIFNRYLTLSPWKENDLPLSGNSSSIRNYSKYLIHKGKFISSMYYYILYLKYKFYLNK